MAGYAKLFATITESSLWSEPKEVRLLFVSMLARADQNGFVEAALPGLARLANLTIEETKSALEVLTSPDLHSKNPANEGKRVLTVSGGWQILNYGVYRSKRGDEKRRKYMREYMKRRRSVNTPLAAVSRRKPPLAQAEAEAEAEADISPPPPTPSKEPAADERHRQVMVVVSDVHSLGVAEAKSAVETALANGCDLDLVRAIVNHYRREGGKKPQALYFRLLNATAGQVIGDGWLPDWKPDQIATDVRRREAERQEQERLADEASAAAAAERESKFGPVVDAMTDDAIREAVSGNLVLAERFKRSGRSPLLREWLINQLARNP